MGNMGKRNLNLELFVVVSWMNSWVSPFIIPDIICFGFLIFTLDTRMVKFFMKLGVKFHFFSWKKGWNFCPFHSFREMKVKWKWLEIEIEKWKWNEKASRSRSRSEISREFSRNSWELRIQEILKFRSKWFSCSKLLLLSKM